MIPFEKNMDINTDKNGFYLAFLIKFNNLFIFKFYFTKLGLTFHELHVS